MIETKPAFTFKYGKSIIILFLLSIFCNQIASFLTWVWMDTLQCSPWVGILCDWWDKLEYWVAHKILAFFFYNAGYYGAMGIVCYNIESVIMKTVFRNNGSPLSKLAEWFVEIFGILAAAVIGIFVGSVVGRYLYLNEVFELFYTTVNSL